MLWSGTTFALINKKIQNIWKKKQTKKQRKKITIDKNTTK